MYNQIRKFNSYTYVMSKTPLNKLYIYMCVYIYILSDTSLQSQYKIMPSLTDNKCQQYIEKQNIRNSIVIMKQNSLVFYQFKCVQIVCKMAVQSMSSSIVTLRNQYICSAIKTDLASQRHDICFLYSKEGTRFQIRKVLTI